MKKHKKHIRTIYGMSIKDWKILGKILNPTTTEDSSFVHCTVAEYIAQHPECVTDRRVSAKGAELVEVTYPTGKVKVYRVCDIDHTTAYEY